MGPADYGSRIQRARCSGHTHADAVLGGATWQRRPDVRTGARRRRRQRVELGSGHPGAPYARSPSSHERGTCASFRALAAWRQSRRSAAQSNHRPTDGWLGLDRRRRSRGHRRSSGCATRTAQTRLRRRFSRARNRRAVGTCHHGNGAGLRNSGGDDRDHAGHRRHAPALSPVCRTVRHYPRFVATLSSHNVGGRFAHPPAGLPAPALDDAAIDPRPNRSRRSGPADDFQCEGGERRRPRKEPQFSLRRGHRAMDPLAGLRPDPQCR